MQPIDVVKQIYQLYALGDLDGALALCSDDFRFEWPVAPDFARYNGTSVGRPGFAEKATALHQDYAYRAFIPIDFVVSEERVAVRTELHMTRRTTGEEFIMQCADFWTIRDGKAVELIEFYDTALASHVN